MSTQVWTVAEAKAKFSEVIDRAQSDGPQTITRNGRTTAVVVAAEEWERKTRRKGNLADERWYSCCGGKSAPSKSVPCRGGVPPRRPAADL